MTEYKKMWWKTMREIENELLVTRKARELFSESKSLDAQIEMLQGILYYMATLKSRKD